MSRLNKSFGYAFNGLKLFFLKEKNGQLELVAAIVTILLGFGLHISKIEWCIILLCIGGVLSLEMINSALEKLIDHLHPDQHNTIKKIKDMGAAAVLWFSIVAFIAGLVIFLPRIYKL
ncbi:MULTISPECIES: diacylglycerol kinase family protein [Chitinophagaceae]